MKVVGEKRGPIRAWRAAMAFAILAGVAGLAPAGELFKCGKVFQDRPCEQSDVQQRFSHAQGTFSIEQVNPGTDKDCARIAADAMTWWRRMNAGAPMEKLRAEIEEQKISRYNKSVMRDVLIAVKNTSGSEHEVRSQYETQCMAYKRRNGYAMERDSAAPARSSSIDAQQSLQQAQSEARRAEMDARRAEMQARQDEARRRAELLRTQAQQRRLEQLQR